jgi:predicted glutamine amidotransferase
MCDLFGMSCNAEDRAWKSLTVLANEYSGKNPHGWGIGYFENGNAIIEKAPEKAKKSQTFFSVIEKAKSSIVIAHIRYATIGDPCVENCHPFKGTLFNRDWIFAHNGTIRNIPHHPHSVGQTDSEHVFHLILDEIEEYQKSGRIHGIFSGIQQGIKTAFNSCGSDNTLNFLLSDGSILYAFNHYDEKPLYYLKRQKPYGGAFLIATQKLSSNEPWKSIRPDSLLIVSNGEILELSDPIIK